MTSVSIIIPTLNEEKALPATLKNIDESSDNIEIIIVDGGSIDSTCILARNHPVSKLFISAPGRALQMNTGALHANGEWLIFLHADTLLPANGIQLIKSLSNQKNILAGCFRHSFSDNSLLLKWISRLHNWRCKRTGIIYGDQTMFIRNSFFKKLGGFPKTKILEDVIFSEKIIKHTKPIILDSITVTDARKFRKRGTCKSFLEIASILICYEFKLPIIGKGFFSAIR